METLLFLKETSQEATNYTQFDELTSWFYQAGMLSRVPGKGAAYMIGFTDSDNAPLSGGSDCRPHLRPKIPAAICCLRPDVNCHSRRR